MLGNKFGCDCEIILKWNYKTTSVLFLIKILGLKNIINVFL